MGKRGRPRKNPASEPEHVGDDGSSPSENSAEVLPQEINETDNPTENTVSSENSSEDMSTSEKPRDDNLPPTDVPKQWNEVPIVELAKQGWYYRSRAEGQGKSGGKYMFIRNRNNERSLGRWSPELEKLLFERYPILYKPKGVEPEEPPASSGRSLGSKPFFNVPIKRIAVIPGDYRPTMDVIRYYHVYKSNGFLGDFSDFMNGIIVTHFVKCHGIVLPVYVNEELVQ